MNNKRYIFVTGGVMSGQGKGVVAASLGATLEWLGYSVRYQKCDGYLNLDPGTMNPLEHGEVFVTEDGLEGDMDFGHFERFTSYTCSRKSSITSGQIYDKVLRAEREGIYLGKTVQVVPHITNEIKTLFNYFEDTDFKIIEVGGTTGDIENSHFMEAIRQFKRKNKCAFIHLVYIIYLDNVNEFKTKPAQFSISLLKQMGIDPDIILARSSKAAPKSILNKLEAFADASTFPAEDLNDIYQIPLNFWERGVVKELLNKFDIDITEKTKKNKSYEEWNKLVSNNGNGKITVGIIGKYDNANESYKSIIEAVRHSCRNKGIGLEFKTIPQEIIPKEWFNDVNGIIVPGGFGTRGVEMKMEGLKYARENNIPCLGICFGLQLMAIEYARNVLGIKDAISEEFETKGTPIICYMPGQKGAIKGATMRLGTFKSRTLVETPLREIYKDEYIYERHRHRLELMYDTYEKYFKGSKLLVGSWYNAESEKDDKLKLVEATYLEGHPFYIGVQYHPEFLSKLFKPHPLFNAFIKTCTKRIIEQPKEKDK